MGIFASFRRDTRGSLTRRVANFAVVVAIAAVVLASLLERATRDGGSSILAFLLPEDPAASSHAPGQVASRRGPQFAGVDPTPTGSIGRPIVLDPCTGAQK